MSIKKIQRTLPKATLKLENKELYNLNYSLVGHRAPIRKEGNYSSYIKKVNNRINAVYNLNRAEILNIHNQREAAEAATYAARGIETRKTPAKRLFVDTVKAYMKEGYDVNDALRITLNSEWYTPKTIRGPRNARIFIKDDKQIYNSFRKAAGWNKKIDWKNFTYDSEKKAYIYNNVMVELKEYTGPEGAQIQRTKISVFNEEKNMYEVYSEFKREKNS